MHSCKDVNMECRGNWNAYFPKCLIVLRVTSKGKKTYFTVLLFYFKWRKKKKPKTKHKTTKNKQTRKKTNQCSNYETIGQNILYPYNLREIKNSTIISETTSGVLRYKGHTELITSNYRKQKSVSKINTFKMYLEQYRHKSLYRHIQIHSACKLEANAQI